MIKQSMWGRMVGIIRSTNSVPDLDKTSSYQLVARAHKLGDFFVLLRLLLILRLLFGRLDRFVQLPFVYQGFRGRSTGKQRSVERKIDQLALSRPKILCDRIAFKSIGNKFCAREICSTLAKVFQSSSFEPIQRTPCNSLGPQTVSFIESNIIIQHF